MEKWIKDAKKNNTQPNVQISNKYVSEYQVMYNSYLRLIINWRDADWVQFKFDTNF